MAFHWRFLYREPCARALAQAHQRGWVDESTTWLAMRRVYGGRWWPRLLRAGLVSLVYLVALGLAMAGVGLWTLLS